MEWLIAVLTIVCSPVLTLVGITVTEKYKMKTKRLEMDSSKDSAIIDCQSKHAANLEKVRGEFNTRLDNIGGKLDEIKTEQLKIALSVTQLQKDTVKSNDILDNVSDRLATLERKVDVLENRESVSEHRLTDLEKMA